MAARCAHCGTRPRRSRFSPDGKIAAATVLLLVGVAAVGVTAEIRAGWWAVGGYLCLFFVPALIFDAVVEKVSQTRERERRP
jgi:hypothetical protein